MIRIDLVDLRHSWDRGTREMRFLVDFDDPADLDADGGEDQLRQVSLEITEDLSHSGNPATAEQWIRTPQGWSAAMFEIASLDDAEEWLEQLTARLQGIAGVIRGGSGVAKVPRWARDGCAAVTAFLYYTTVDLRTIDSDDRGPVWGVGRAPTLRLADQLLLWAHRNRATEILTRAADWTVETVGLDHAASMAEAIERYPSLQTRSVGREPSHARSTSLNPHGHVVAQAQDDAPWRERVAAVQEVLALLPSSTDYGYIQWSDGGGATPDRGENWPHIAEYHLRYNRPLLTSFVPDAFAIQLLTDAHLERAHDLTDWEVTPLGDARHLVQAKDLDPWFSPIPNRTDREYWLHDAPPHDKSILENARADFGDMILTPELIEQHDPWR